MEPDEREKKKQEVFDLVWKATSDTAEAVRHDRTPHEFEIETEITEKIMALFDGEN